MEAEGRVVHCQVQVWSVDAIQFAETVEAVEDWSGSSEFTDIPCV